MELCISLNKSLPGIESDLLKSPLSHIVNNSLICLAVYQNLSIMFRPVIKQIKNKDGNTTVQPTNNTRGLPFLCRVKTGKVRSVKNNGFFQCNNYFETSKKSCIEIRDAFVFTYTNAQIIKKILHVCANKKHN